jgi:hypothetical protein
MNTDKHRLEKTNCWPVDALSYLCSSCSAEILDLVILERSEGSVVRAIPRRPDPSLRSRMTIDGSSKAGFQHAINMPLMDG